MTLAMQGVGGKDMTSLEIEILKTPYRLAQYDSTLSSLLNDAASGGTQ